MASSQNTEERLRTALADRYVIEREIGRGGMGVVYLARDVALDRAVAIKVLPAEVTSDLHHRERFLREARTAAGLAHPNIVPIHLVEARDDLVCFIMGYISGETLGDRVRRAGPLPPGEVIRIVREVAWALAYAHGRGVIHRDIKPDNILLEHGTDRALVTDFGIARVIAEGTLSGQGEVIGTLQYMPPEQIDAGAELDGRSDLYALGVTAFFALTGRLPFESTSAPALLAMHLTEPAPPVTSVRPGIPARLAGAVDRCLAKEPSARFESAEILADVLGEMAVSKAIPPSILTLREISTTAGQLIILPGFLYYIMLEVAFQPDWAPALATVWACLGAMGTFAFLMSVRAVVRAGHSTEEVGEAARQIVAASQQDRNALIAREQGRKLEGYMEKPLGRIIVGGLGALCLSMAVGVLFDALHDGASFPIDLWAIPGTAILSGFGALLLGKALRLGPFRWESREGLTYERRSAWLQRWAKKFWDNPIMRTIFRIAGLGAAPPKMAGEVVEQGATEIILGQAADSIFSALPKPDRQRLSDVPQVIRELEAAAGALRSRRDELERAIADAGTVESGGGSRRAQIVEEMEAAKAVVAERLQRVVTALENLRLDLLRLRAGIGETAEITGALEAARKVSIDISAEMEGRTEVERLT